MITTGTTGSEWRASITPWGGIEPWGSEATLNWYVAADDRWHVPADEAAVRQQRIEGTPVTETRIRVPNGDVVQRVFSIADHGGLTVVEFENESTLPVAIALDRRDVLTERPIAEVPIEGVDLPDSAFVMPLGHAATIRVALSHGTQRHAPLPGGLPGHLQVVRGWTTTLERASRLVLPDGEAGSSLVATITAERSELALGSVPHAADDPVAFAVALGELVRMGERPDPWLPELAEAIEAIGPVPGWDGDVACDAATLVLNRADEPRAARDLQRIVERRQSSSHPAEPATGLLAIAWLERLLAHRGELMPTGLPRAWLGQAVEAYGVPSGPASTVSFAIRWHAERPAVLWEQAGTAIELTSPVLAPDWSSSEVKGETLWPAPA